MNETNRMEIKTEEKDNRLFVRLQKETSGVITSRELNPFKYERKNILLTKMKRQEAINKYTMAIRIDGKEENARQYKLAQIELTKEEMKTFRDTLNELLEVDE